MDRLLVECLYGATRYDCSGSSVVFVAGMAFDRLYRVLYSWVNMLPQETLQRMIDQAPSHLEELRRIKSGQSARTDAERWLEQWRREKPRDFMAAYQKAEQDYRLEQIAKQGKGRQAVPESTGPDEGSERAKELVREWLKAEEAGT